MGISYMNQGVGKPQGMMFFFGFLMLELTGGGSWEPQRFLGNLKETTANLMED